MMVSIIKYNAGNILSVCNALERIGAEYAVTDDEKTILNSDRVIFPGVGEAFSAVSYLKEKKLDETIKKIEAPFLGICLGMQLLGTFSSERNTECLNIIPGRCNKFEKNRGYKVPHVGWNQVKIEKDDPLFYGIEDNSYFYFVHSYYMEKSEYAIASTDYDDIAFSSALRLNNFRGVQFHPEKSGKDGERLLKNFLEVTC